MGGFNPINIIVNTASIFAVYQNANSNAARNNPNVQNAQNNAPLGTSLNNTGLQNTNIYSSTTSALYSSGTLSSANQLLISTVEIEQRANYIKDLLNLPRDFEAFIKMIQGQNMNMQAMKDLSKLLNNGKINLGELTVLLGDNSKEAIQKLMMTIMTVSKMGSNDVSQLKELMAMFSASGGQVDNSNTLKNLLMLYLPWLPLSIRNELNLDFDIDIFDKIQGADENNENSGEVIRIMVQTANFGNILATLELNSKNEVDVFIQANENFPEKEILKMFKKENKQSNITSNVTVEKNKSANNQTSKDKNVQITSSNYVSPKLILAAHSLIKIIIDVDNQEFIINEETEG